MSTTNANQSIYYLYGFNSYSDRRCIKYDTLQEYLALTTIEYDVQPTTNFCEGDGVVRGKVTYRKSASMPKGTPNYAIVVDSLGTIQSRWYVVDSLNKNVSTYELVLKRDSVADYYDDIIAAPTFIEKATVSSNDPFIFNDEGISVNQIKQSETLLQDPSKCAWVVGYLSPDTTATTITSNEAVEIDGSFATPEDFGTYLTSLGIKDYCATSESSLSGSGIPASPVSRDTKVNSFRTRFICRAPAYLDSTATQNIGYNCFEFSFNANSSSVSGSVVQGPGASVADVNDYTNLNDYAYNVSVNLFKGWTNVRNNIAIQISNVTSTIQSSILSYTQHSTTYSHINNFQSKKYKVGNDYYQLSFSHYSYENADVGSGNFNTNNTGYGFISALNGLNEFTSRNTANLNTIYWGEVLETAYISVIKISSAELSIDLTGGERICGTLPYKMFAIPYSRTGDITVRYGTSSSYTTINMAKDLALSIGKAISAKYSGANALYDLQLLPYCPAQNIIVGERTILVPTNNTITSLVKRNNTNIGVVYWCADNQGTFDISHNISITNTKLESITDMYRLSSPNWNGQFEFNAAKNGGVNKFNVDFTYKPHMPYIHINPNFGRLYGQDFDDARGLICQGDFSLPQTSDAWNTYEIQNKNYQTQFQRQIDNMEVNHSIEKEQLIWKTVAGSLQGGVTGAAMGAMAGGIPGAIAGGVLGAGLSAVGGARDIQLNEKSYREQTSYATDIHNMQLDNIQAMPSNLTNVGAMTYNNKLFPILEYYSCSDEEKQAIVDYLYYYGMTVGKVGSIADYLQDEPSFISGQIIRLTINEENHMINDIRNEIKEGVFLQ